MWTFNEWVAVFEKKTGEKHVNPKGYKTIFDSEKGYCQILIKNGDINVHECCGDGRFWYEFVFEILKKHSLKRIVLLCTRQILPYLRLMGAEITTKRIEKDKHNGYYIEGITKGNAFRCFPIWWNEKTKLNAYAIIVEV